jgi:hypothetical protein
MKSILTGGLMALAISTAGAGEQNRFSANSMLLACKRFIGEGGQASASVNPETSCHPSSPRLLDAVAVRPSRLR